MGYKISINLSHNQFEFVNCTGNEPLTVVGHIGFTPMLKLMLKLLEPLMLSLVTNFLFSEVPGI